MINGKTSNSPTPNSSGDRDDQDAEDFVFDRLKSYLDDVAAQPIPDQMTALLARLDQLDGGR